MYGIVYSGAIAWQGGPHDGADERVSLPMIGCGGIHSAADARIFLHAGAIAIQVEAAIWHDPACLARMARNPSPAAEPR